MSQNIYNNAKFFKGYGQLPRSVEGFTAAPEWEAAKALFADLSGSRILDLGCGFGAFDRWAIEPGASLIIGLDLSENMLNRARELPRAKPDGRNASSTFLTLLPVPVTLFSA